MTKQFADATPEIKAVNDRSDAESPMDASLPPTSRRQEVQVEDSGAILCDANFCRVTGTPEELILESGLSSQPMNGETRIEVKQRLVVNYFTAKRILSGVELIDPASRVRVRRPGDGCAEASQSGAATGSVQWLTSCACVPAVTAQNVTLLGRVSVSA